MRYLIPLLALLATSACAEPQAGEHGAAVPTDSSAAVARLKSAFPGIPLGKVEPAPVPGMWQVQVRGEWLLMTADGQYVFAGEVFDLRPEGPVSLVEERMQRDRVPAIAALDEQQMITFTAATEKSEIYVFTDITCGYCRQLHRQIDDYTSRGITVHYLAFPRGGLSSDTAKQMAELWCAEDRQTAMTEAKLQGRILEIPKPCDAPIAAQYQLGVSFGVKGTPAIFTRAGEQLGGYLSPEDMATALDI